MGFVGFVIVNMSVLVDIYIYGNDRVGIYDDVFNYFGVGINKVIIFDNSGFGL